MKPASRSNPNSVKAAQVSSKKNNVLWWVLGIGGGLAAWLLFSSFKGADPALPDGTTGATLPPCVNDYNCSRGYWSWELLNTDQKRKEIAIRASQSGKTVMQQAFDEAAQNMSGSPVNLAAFETEVSTTIAKWKISTSMVKMITDKSITNKVSMDQQFRDDAVWAIISTLSDRAKNSAGTSSSTAVSGLGNNTINLL